MIRPYRLLAGLALALSLTGCAGLPGSLLASVPAATASEDASLKVTVGTGYQTQAFPDIALSLRLELPNAEDPAKRVQVISVQDGVPAEFKNLPRGSGTLTAIATSVTTKKLVDKQSQPIELRPGFQAQVQFRLVVGGSSALDLGVGFMTDAKDLRFVSEGDGLDNDFRNPYVTGAEQQYVWRRGEQSVPVVLYHDENQEWFRRVGDGPDDSIGNNVWLFVPRHAVRVDSEPLGTVDRVRHYRWENVYRVDAETEEMLIVDRWISPYMGLLKEEVRRTVDGPPVASLEMAYLGEERQ